MENIKCPAADLVRTQLQAKERLKKHDWHYEMSNSNRVYVKGRADKRSIEEILCFLSFEVAKELFDTLSPKGFEYSQAQYDNAKQRIVNKLNSGLNLGACDD